jgi:hypothetical protein
MPTPKDFVDDWLRQSLDPSLGTNPFMRFMNAWIAFNALYASQIDSVDGDWNQVKKFAEDERLVEMHRRLLRHPSLPAYSQAIDVLAAHGVTNVKMGRRRDIRLEKPLLDVLQCIYQVRCNLFHGDKFMSNERDAELVTAAFVVITNLLTFYFTGKIVGGWERVVERAERNKRLPMADE